MNIPADNHEIDSDCFSVPEDLTALIRDARNGCSRSLGGLLNLFQPRLLAMADRTISPFLRRRMSRSDLVQDTMLSASKDFSSFQGESIGELTEWLEKLFHSRLITGLRRHRLAKKRSVHRESHQRLSGLIENSDSPSELASVSEESLRLLNAMKLLPDSLREVVNMHYLERLSFAEIGELNGVARTTIWRQWMRAIEMIQCHMNVQSESPLNSEPEDTT